ncbi:RNA-directed DNA polymerase, eukaryota [Tanacetum coccineum]
MESLHISFSRVVDDGLFKGFQLHGSVNISHLFYADDAMFIGEWSEQNLHNIVKVLNCFHLASGLKINIAKSQVLGVGVSQNVVLQAANRIGCAVLNTPFRYLGVTVGECMSRKSAWVGLVNKLQARLSKWKVKTLSIGGRLTLLKSVLGASPIYYMSIFKVPKGVLKTMESIRSKFFNGVDSSDRKISWVAWDNVLASKLNGGLGVSSFFALNRALLLKWVWRFISGDGSLWCKVIQAIYGSKFDLHVTDQPSIWCSILREVKSLKDSGFDFSSHCKKRIGDGSCTSFWYDIWLADAPLCVQFPRLFALELDKEIVVANKMGASSVSASFRRDVRDGAERQQWDDLSSIMNSVVLSSSKDRWTCDLSGDGEFKVKVIRNFIDDLFLPSSDVATRWVKFIPIKVNVFSWRARRDRLPTRVNLSRRGVLLDSHLCPLCNAAMEDVQHVFFRCDVARVVLRKICRWWDLDWQEICSFSDWDAWFLSFRLSSRLKSILEGVFYVAWWRIWRLRNQLVFDASPPNRSTIFDDIVSCSLLVFFNKVAVQKKSERSSRMALFNRIVTAVTNHDPYFHNNIDYTGRKGISLLIKCTSAIRQLAYIVNASFLDEYMQISERSSRMALDHFFEVVMDIYGPEYLRKPTVTDIEKLYRHHEEKHKFLGMLGCLDCTNWEWFGCPYAFKGQFVRRGHGSNPFILLEAVVSQDL